MTGHGISVAGFGDPQKPRFRGERPPPRPSRGGPTSRSGQWRVRVDIALVLLFAAPAWGGPLTVVTTSTDLRSLVEVVAGGRVRVESLAPPIHEPHQVEVKPSQIALLRS